MCGITGLIDFHDDLSCMGPALDRMVATLENRGPDSSGTWLSRRAVLGHRRLAVVDPAGGAQPMARSVGARTYVITYNGELYNSDELRQALESRGWQFHTHCDTEVLLVSYIEWGPACVERLNGIFAFGVWSEADETFFMARDRMGVKPCFYMEQGSAFIFGSEPKAILAHPEVRAELGLEGLAELLLLGPSRTPGHGVYRGMKELRPAHCLLLRSSGLRVWRYWNVASAPHTDDLEATSEKVRWLLRDTCLRQLVADVPVCSFLSGGLDSSAVTAFAQEGLAVEGLGPIRTYSVDYVDNDRNFRKTAFQPDADSPWVRVMSEYLGTSHRDVLVDTPEVVDALKAAVRARDMPGMADVDSSLYLFCREVKKEATVALSGESADEVFGGYPWFHKEELLNAGTFPWNRRTSARMSLLEPGLRGKMEALDYVNCRYRETLDEVPVLPGEEPMEARRREMFYLNMIWFLTTLLDRKDRMSMATGLEVRVPFCDHRIVEYAWNIPWEMKMHHGREKGLLRHSLEGVLPEEVIWRKKSPYPKSWNPTYRLAMEAWMREVIADSASPIMPLLDRVALDDVMQSDGGQFAVPWFGQLMARPHLYAYLCSMDWWLREYRVSIV